MFVTRPTIATTPYKTHAYEHLTLLSWWCCCRYGIVGIVGIVISVCQPHKVPSRHTHVIYSTYFPSVFYFFIIFIVAVLCTKLFALFVEFSYAEGEGGGVDWETKRPNSATYTGKRENHFNASGHKNTNSKGIPIMCCVYVCVCAWLRAFDWVYHNIYLYTREKNAKDYNFKSIKQYIKRLRQI